MFVALQQLPRAGITQLSKMAGPQQQPQQQLLLVVGRCSGGHLDLGKRLLSSAEVSTALRHTITWSSAVLIQVNHTLPDILQCCGAEIIYFRLRLHLCP